MKGPRGAAVIAAILMTLSATAVPAAAQTSKVVDVLLTCRARASHPRPANASITSTGSFGCGQSVVMEVTVCLELAQIPVSCTTEGPTVARSLTATSDPIPCIPGVYQTRTVGRVIEPFPMTHTIHSLPPVVIVQCV